jgi:hypothetical protein
MTSEVERVALALTRLALPAVSMRPRPALLDSTVRAAVLIDLALSGALVGAGGGIEVDTDPTGFDPADRLLASVVAQPDRQIGWWLYHAPLTLDDLAKELIVRDTWERRGALRRYRDLHPDQRAAEMERLVHAAERGDCTPTQAATAALLELLPLPKDHAGFGTSDLVAQSGDAAWIMPDLLDNLRRRRATLIASAKDAQTAQSSNFIF